MNRRDNGQFEPGPMSDDLKQLISEGQVARHAARIAQEEGLASSTKRCVRCEQWKRVPEDYVMRKRKLKSGLVREYPSSECRACEKLRVAEYRERFIAEHGEEAWRERQRKYNQRRDPEKKRQYNREWGRAKREREGAKARGPWKRYRVEERTRVDKVPFYEWYDEYMPHARRRYSDEWGTFERETFCVAHDVTVAEYDFIRRSRTRDDIHQLDLELVDRFMTAAGAVEVLHQIYPIASVPEWTPRGSTTV